MNIILKKCKKELRILFNVISYIFKFFIKNLDIFIYIKNIRLIKTTANIFTNFYKIYN